MTAPADLGNLGKGIRKVAEDPQKLGRRQIHGEIIAIKEVELFENIEPLTQAFHAMCNYYNDDEHAPRHPTPDAPRSIALISWCASRAGLSQRKGGGPPRVLRY